MDGTLVGRVALLLRYPVKSTAGEEPDRVELDARGVVGDRLWAVLDPDGKIGSGKSTRRFRRMDGLAALTASYDGDVPVLTWPDGTVRRGGDPATDEALSAQVGRPVALRREGEVPHADEGPLHLVTTAALAAASAAHGSPVDPRRLRPNLVVDTGAATGHVEDGWEGRRLAVGERCVVEVGYPMPRCVMVDLPQAGVDADGRLLRTLADTHDACLGAVASVLVPGPVALGDEVRLLG